jgi:hypothetical protein
MSKAPVFHQIELAAHRQALLSALEALILAMNDAEPGDPRVNAAMQALDIGISELMVAAANEGARMALAAKAERKKARQKRVNKPTEDAFVEEDAL